MTTPRALSPAAQAVLDAVLNEASPLSEQRQQRMDVAAAIRALVEKTLPAEEPTYTLQQTQRRRTRTKQLAIAAELDGGAPQPTTPEPPTDD